MYNICYNTFYDLYQAQEWRPFVLPFDRNTTSFFIYMFMTYKNLDQLTKRQLKDIFSIIYYKYLNK